MSIIVTDLKTEFGKNIGTPQGKDFIRKELLVPSKTEEEFNMLPSSKTQERKAKAAVGQVLQAFQAQVTAVGNVTFTPNKIDLQELKYELELDPDVLEDTVLGYTTNPDTNDRTNWAITQYIARELMIQKGRENFELFEAYKGVKAAIVPGTASALGASYNGLGKVIADGILAGTNPIVPVNSIAVWPTTPSDFVTEIEKWVEANRATSEINRTIIDNAVDKIYMSQTLAQRFKQGMKDKYNVNYLQASDATKVWVAENIQVVGLPSMSGRNRVFMTFKENRAGYIKRPNSETELGISTANPYKPLFYAKFWKALGFWHNEYVYCNQLV